MGEIDLIEIGKRIQARRKKMALTQETLADRMNVSLQMVSNLERGIKSIRIENLVKLCQILEVSTDYILTGKESPQELNRMTSRLELLPDKQRKMVEHLIDYCISENE